MSGHDKTESAVTLGRNTQDQHYSDDSDNILVQLRECSKYDDDWYFGIADGNNHSEFKRSGHPMNEEDHCWLYHSLYDHTHLGWLDLLRIGCIWIDVNVEYQKAFEV